MTALKDITRYDFWNEATGEPVSGEAADDGAFVRYEEYAALLQAVTDPENQPNQFGRTLPTSNEQFRTAVALLVGAVRDTLHAHREATSCCTVTRLYLERVEELLTITAPETSAEPIDGRDRIEQCVREIQQICDWGNMDASEWLNDETAIGEKPRERPQPIATVIDNNQPGWTNIIETAPNVTLPVGTKLYDQNALLAVGARVVDEIWQRESSEKASGEPT